MMETLINNKYKNMTDFEKVLWLELENKTLKQENKVLRKTTSSKDAREKNKQLKRENITLFKRLKELESKSNLNSEYNIGDTIYFQYKDIKTYGRIRTICKNHLTVEAFEDRNDGYRVKYNEIING